MFDIRITKNRTCLLVQPSTPSTIKFLSIAYLSLLDYLAFLYTGLRLSWLGAPVAWYWEQAGPRLFGGPIRPLCDNADPFIFCGWPKNLEWTFSRSKAPPKRCLFSIPPPSKDCSFPLGLGRERL